MGQRMNLLDDSVKASACIVVHERWTHGDGNAVAARKYRTYEWYGPRWGLAWVDERVLDELQALHWPIRVIGLDWRQARYLVARTDGACLITAWWHDLRMRARNLLALVKARLIITAMVWGLGYVPEGEIPSWRHLFRRPDE